MQFDQLTVFFIHDCYRSRYFKNPWRRHGLAIHSSCSGRGDYELAAYIDLTLKTKSGIPSKNLQLEHQLSKEVEFEKRHGLGHSKGIAFTSSPWTSTTDPGLDEDSRTTHRQSGGGLRLKYSVCILHEWQENTSCESVANSYLCSRQDYLWDPLFAAQDARPESEKL